MKIKVCGMRMPDNIRHVGALPIDWMGFIFYDRSPRYAGEMSPTCLECLPATIRRVGVFVNAAVEEVLKTTEKYALHTVQLHGSETPDDCHLLRDCGLEVIKAFSIATKKDLDGTQSYATFCDYYLFDTKTPLFGGSGTQYDWSLLRDYPGDTPFLLSGGIGSDDVDRIRTFSHPCWAGIDLNSRFEKESGYKNVWQLQQFVEKIKAN